MDDQEYEVTNAGDPLCVDLDGTLIRTDILVESVFALLKQNAFYLLLLPLWLFRGKSNLKHQIALRTEIDPRHLPYNSELLGFLRSQKQLGRRIVLATASNQKPAVNISEHLDIFSEVFASTPNTNLSGKRKLESLQDAFGDKGFDYVGDAMVDLAIWRRANRVYVANPSSRVKRRVGRELKVERIFGDSIGSTSRSYLRALRIHQWMKNLLVFAPATMAHRLGEPELLAKCFVAFLSFGLCASSVYLLNDLLDLNEDRQHNTKRRRPFASGDIPVIHGVLLFPMLLVGAFVVASMLPLRFNLVLGIYYCVTLTYSLRLKRIPVLDVLLLAGLYTIRIIAGAAAAGLFASFWLLAFSVFLFLSLALLKRFTEIYALLQAGQESAPGRGYLASDVETLAHFGTSSAYMAVLVLAFYINSTAVKGLYGRPELIWCLCPLLLYILTRLWLLARRSEMHDDPVVFVLRDRQSQLVGILGAVMLWVAT